MVVKEQMLTIFSNALINNINISGTIKPPLVSASLTKLFCFFPCKLIIRQVNIFVAGSITTYFTVMR